MKIKFNKIGGQVQKLALCNKCVFRNTRFCREINYNDPLYVPCFGIGFIETNLDIFEL